MSKEIGMMLLRLLGRHCWWSVKKPSFSLLVGLCFLLIYMALFTRLIWVPLAGCPKSLGFFFSPALIGAMKMCYILLTLCWVGNYCSWVTPKNEHRRVLFAVVLKVNCWQSQENISALVPSAYSLQSDEAEFVAAHFELENWFMLRLCVLKPYLVSSYEKRFIKV